MPASSWVLQLVIYLACSIGVVAKEPAKIPPPIPPLIAPVPENADWTVLVKNPPAEKGQKDKEAFITEVRSTKFGKVKRDLVKAGDGKTRELWFYDKLLIWPTATGDLAVNDLSAAPAPDPADPNPSIADGFPGVAWINAERFAGVKLFNEKQCYHYVNGEMEAWIDVKTKLPVGYKIGKTSYRFKFNPAPSEVLKLPTAYQEALDTVSQTRNRP